MFSVHHQVRAHLNHLKHFLKVQSALKVAMSVILLNLVILRSHWLMRNVCLTHLIFVTRSEAIQRTVCGILILKVLLEASDLSLALRELVFKQDTFFPGIGGAQDV